MWWEHKAHLWVTELPLEADWDEMSIQEASGASGKELLHRISISSPLWVIWGESGFLEYCFLFHMPLECYRPPYIYLWVSWCGEEYSSLYTQAYWTKLQWPYFNLVWKSSNEHTINDCDKNGTSIWADYLLYSFQMKVKMRKKLVETEAMLGERRAYTSRDSN